MNTIEFATTGELMTYLRQEAATPSRFAVRFIHVDGLQVWKELAEALRSECAVVALSELCDDAQSCPYLGGLIGLLQANPRDQIALLPLGEVLRLWPKQAPIERLATWEERPSRRVYAPLLDCADTLASSLDHVGRYRAGECELWAVRGGDDSEQKLVLHVSPVAIKSQEQVVVEGFRPYLELWERGGASRMLLVTPWTAQFQGRQGYVTVRVSPNAHAALCAQLRDGQAPAIALGDEERWAWLAREALPGETFDDLAGRLLGIPRYESALAIAAWAGLPAELRWLAWVWGQTLARAGSFADTVMNQTPSPDRLAEIVAMYPFVQTLDPTQARERRELLRRLGADGLPAAFWAAYEAERDPFKRLTALPGLSQREREQIVLLVAELLRAGAGEDSWLPYLEVTFPELAAYLTRFPYRDESLRAYMRLYTRCKVMDQASAEFLELGQAWANERTLWDWPSRAGLLKKAARAPRHWVDGLGIEWAGLLGSLLNDTRVQVNIELGRAELPTSTGYNRDWKPEERVERDLDLMAHAYNYSYPSSLVQQIEWVGALAGRLRNECSTSGALLVSGDHGLTRFAAHGNRIAPPTGCQVHKWGRYATLIVDTPAPEGNAWRAYNNCLVLAGHSLFEGGHAPIGGEAHGGATIEEALVPVIHLAPRLQQLPRIVLCEPRVRLSARGQGEFRIELSGPVTELWMSIAERTFAAERLDGARWVISLRDMQAGRWTARIECELGLLGEIEIEAMRGIAQDNMGLL